MSPLLTNAFDVFPLQQAQQHWLLGGITLCVINSILAVIWQGFGSVYHYLCVRQLRLVARKNANAALAEKDDPES